MPWPPYSTLDLTRHSLLPADWQAQAEAATGATERLPIISPLGSSPDDGKFSIIAGADVHARFEWLWRLYLGPIRAFAAERFGSLFPANRISSAITLNILEGEGAAQDWHLDATAVTGIFFASTLQPGDGGALEFRAEDGDIARVMPRAGHFVCFPGPTWHRVAPLLKPIQRLSFPMLFYASATDQPFASEHDRHEMSSA